MDNLNKTVSFILGLVVVIVFLAFITGRLNLRSRVPILGGPTATATPTRSAVRPTPTPLVVGKVAPTSATYRPYTSIPATGSPTLLIPILLSGLMGGIFLKRKT